MNSQSSYQSVLNEKGFIVVNITGTSMLPLLKENRNTVLLIKPNRPIRKKDVLLYKRLDGTFVLHRLLKIKNNSYVMCGDHQWQLEYNVQKNQIIGVMEGYYRKEKYISIASKMYRIYCFFHTKTRWCRYLRDKIIRVLVKFKKLFNKKSKE